MSFKRVFLFLLVGILTPFGVVWSENINPKEIVRNAINYWRDDSSHAVATMVVHRPNWERSMTFESWTKGSNKALVKFIAPVKDSGNATLSIDDDTWSYSPKINKVIRIPPSMKSQSWMGSDFSYRDLTKADDIIEDYTHKIISTETSDLKKVYVIESIPLESAPVVWGKEILKIREDWIIIQHDFYDQDGQLIKSLVVKNISKMDGKLYPKVMHISKVELTDEWTEIIHDTIKFDDNIPDSFFSTASLGNLK
ncbi:MAG: outer membrane lipoprotein-sorting protein [bacterium]|nr:outer membrane lipoprotein-sorting protein [bacterium]